MDEKDKGVVGGCGKTVFFPALCVASGRARQRFGDGVAKQQRVIAKSIQICLCVYVRIQDMCVREKWEPALLYYTAEHCSGRIRRWGLSGRTLVLRRNCFPRRCGPFPSGLLVLGPRFAARGYSKCRFGIVLRAPSASYHV